MKTFTGICSEHYPTPTDQVERLSGSDFFPANTAALSEVINTLIEYADDAPHIDRMVTMWIRRTRKMLHPSDVPLLAKKTALQKPKPPIPPGCDICAGADWIFTLDHRGQEVMARCACPRGRYLIRRDRERISQPEQPAYVAPEVPQDYYVPATPKTLEPVRAILPAAPEILPEIPEDKRITQADIDRALAERDKNPKTPQDLAYSDTPAKTTT